MSRARLALVLWATLSAAAAGARQANDDVQQPSGAQQPTVAQQPGAEQPAATPVDGKLLYALGVIISTGIDNFELSETEFAQVAAGFADGYRHRADVAQAMSYDPQLQVLRRARVQAMTEREKTAGRAYLAAVAADHGATRTASGLVYVPITAGRGAQPSFNDTVRMNYVGKLVDGAEFDSSAARGAPATISLNDVMPCFTEGLQLMRVGGKARIVCPPELAYGDRGSAPKVRPGATLEYDVELLEVLPARKP